MITESLPQTQQENLPFEVKLQNRLAQKDETISEISNALDESKNTIADRDNTIVEMGNALDEKDNTIAEKDNVIEILKAHLDENNIPYSLD